MKIFDPITEFQEAVEHVDRYLLEAPPRPMSECLKYIHEDLNRKPPAKKIGMEERIQEMES